MTPLGHTGIALLIGTGFSKILPGNQEVILIGTTLGGVALDFDILYRFYQKGTKTFDKTIGKHRFFPTHTPFFAFVISTIISIFSIYFGIAFFIGTLIHLFLDTLFFPEGINFTYPFNIKMYRFFTIKTHPFWAPKQISQVKDWPKNYLTSPIFWVFEVLPTLVSVVVLLLEVK